MKNIEKDPFMPEGRDDLLKDDDKLERLGALTTEAAEAIAAHVRENHERWIRNVQEGSASLGVLAARFGLSIAELGGLVNAVEHTSKGEFEAALSSVGVVALANVARKIVNYGVRKGMPEDWTLRQRDLSLMDERTVTNLKDLYQEDPARAKGVIGQVRREIQNAEGDDYERDDKRADHLKYVGDDPARVKEAEENFVYWDANAAMDLYKDDPEKRKKYLRILGGYVNDRLGRIEKDELERMYNQ